MAYYNSRSDIRESGTFDVSPDTEMLTAACIAEAVKDLDSARSCIVLLRHPGKTAVLASRGLTLSPATRELAMTWLSSATQTHVQCVPAGLRSALGTFRALTTPLASPMASYGAVALSSPTGELCTHLFRRQLESLASDWVLQIEAAARAGLRTNPAIHISIPALPAVAALA